MFSEIVMNLNMTANGVKESLKDVFSIGYFL